MRELRILSTESTTPFKCVAMFSTVAIFLVSIIHMYWATDPIWWIASENEPLPVADTRQWIDNCDRRIFVDVWITASGRLSFSERAGAEIEDPYFARILAKIREDSGGFPPIEIWAEALAKWSAVANRMRLIRDAGGNAVKLAYRQPDNIYARNIGLWIGKAPTNEFVKVHADLQTLTVNGVPVEASLMEEFLHKMAAADPTQVVSFSCGTNATMQTFFDALAPVARSFKNISVKLDDGT